MSLPPRPGADSGSQEGARYETVSALTNQGLACAERGQPSCSEALCADRLAPHDRTPRGPENAVERSEAQLVNLSWQIVDGDIAIPVEEAEWWGASLAILVAALHHPHLLAIQQPETDPASVAKEVLGALDEFGVAARSAEAASQHTEPSAWGRASVRRDGNRIVFSPGEELVP